MLAHELGHVKNRDILTSSIAATLAGAITMVARMGYWASLFGGWRWRWAQQGAWWWWAGCAADDYCGADCGFADSAGDLAVAGV